MRERERTWKLKFYADGKGTLEHMRAVLKETEPDPKPKEPAWWRPPVIERNPLGIGER